MLTVGSCFAGVGGFDLGFERAGAKVVWNCEIDRHCRQVLRKHWPGIPRFKDVKTVTGAGLGATGLRPDVLVGGFPCQDVSVAGARAGLAGERSGLFFEFARLLDEIRPAWTVIENVPGLLSSQRGRDMGAVLGVLADIGYVGAWRVLDAQYFGVAQRRRRVFVVGCLGDRARAAEVLLEPEGGGGDPPARREAGAGVAAGAGGCVAGDGDLVTGLTGSFGNGGADDNKAQAGWLLPDVSYSLMGQRGQRNDPTDQTFLPIGFYPTGGTHGISDVEDGVPAIKVGSGLGIPSAPAVAFPVYPECLPQAVRRLTPTECLRLQGFPDDWLDGLKLPDSIKYRQCGNAVCVPVVEWLARRLVARAG